MEKINDKKMDELNEALSSSEKIEDDPRFKAGQNHVGDMLKELHVDAIDDDSPFYESLDEDVRSFYLNKDNMITPNLENKITVGGKEYKMTYYGRRYEIMHPKVLVPEAIKTLIGEKDAEFGKFLMEDVFNKYTILGYFQKPMRMQLYSKENEKRWMNLAYLYIKEHPEGLKSEEHPGGLIDGE